MRPGPKSWLLRHGSCLDQLHIEVATAQHPWILNFIEDNNWALLIRSNWKFSAINDSNGVYISVESFGEQYLDSPKWFQRDPHRQQGSSEFRKESSACPPLESSQSKSRWSRLRQKISFLIRKPSNRMRILDMWPSEMLIFFPNASFRSSGFTLAQSKSEKSGLR